jgi:hypothetical protein
MATSREKPKEDVTPVQKGKSKEELLREEVRFWMDITIKMMQWGLTLMATLQTAIVFLRREFLNTYIATGLLKPGEELPYKRYLMGTVFLGVAALILWALTNRSNQQYRHYKVQLIRSSESGIDDKPPSGIGKYLMYLFFAFPVLDLIFKVWTVEIKIR